MCYVNTLSFCHGFFCEVKCVEYFLLGNEHGSCDQDPLKPFLYYCNLWRNKKLVMRVNGMFGDLKKNPNFSSFLTDRKLKEISPKATAFHFGTIKP